MPKPIDEIFATPNAIEYLSGSSWYENTGGDLILPGNKKVSLPRLVLPPYKILCILLFLSCSIVIALSWAPVKEYYGSLRISIELTRTLDFERARVKNY